MPRLDTTSSPVHHLKTVLTPGSRDHKQGVTSSALCAFLNRKGGDQHASLQEAVRELQPLISDWPLETIMALYQRRMTALVTALRTSESPEAFQEYWDAIRPYQLAASSVEEKLDIGKPSLYLISMDTAQRLQRFKHHVYHDILVPAVLGGAERATKLKWLAARFSEKVTEDIGNEHLEEDTFLTALVELEQTMNAILALISQNINDMLACKAGISDLYARRNDIHNKAPLSIVACATKGKPYWDDRWLAWHKLTNVLETHGDTLEKLSTYVEFALPAVSTEQLLVLTEQCQRLMVLKDNLPETLLDPIREKLWQHILKLMEEQLGTSTDCQLDLDVFANLLLEAQLTFPEKECISEGIAMLGTLTREKNSSKKLTELLDAIKELPVESQPDTINCDTHLHPLLKLARQAKGIVLNDSAKSNIQAAFDHWAQWLEGRSDAGDSTFQVPLLHRGRG